MICFNQRLVEKELKHLKNTFHKKNGYPLWMINQVMETVKETINAETVSTNQLGILEANNDKLHSLILPYLGSKGNNIKSMNINIQRILPNNMKTRITYTGRKLGTKFQIKDLTKNQHEHVDLKGLKVIDMNYHGSKYKRKISETLYIKQYQP